MEENQEDINIGGGIFTDSDKQTESLRKSAEALGINPDLVAQENDGPQIKYYARKGCKHCFGIGILNVCLSPSKKRVFWKNERKPCKISFRQTKAARSRRIGPTKPVEKTITGFSVGNELGESWNTKRKEPPNYKEDNMSQSFCRCIRAVEV